MMNHLNKVLVPKSKTIKKHVNTSFKFSFLALIIFLLYFPILIIIIQSFNSDGQGHYFGEFTFRWYKEMLNDTNLVRSILITISVAVLATLISTILGTLFAIGIHSSNKQRRKRLITMNNVPVLNADVVTGVALFFIFKAFGVLIGREYLLGYETMLIAHVFFCIPYVILSVLPKLNEVDNNLYDAAVDLGCNPKGALLKVIIPSIKTGILTGALLAFTMSFDDFVISYMVSGEEIKNFSMWIYANQKLSGRSMAWPKAYAYNSIVSIVLLVTLVIYNIVVIKKQKRKVSEK